MFGHFGRVAPIQQPLGGKKKRGKPERVAAVANLLVDLVNECVHEGLSGQTEKSMGIMKSYEIHGS